MVGCLHGLHVVRTSGRWGLEVSQAKGMRVAEGHVLGTSKELHSGHYGWRVVCAVQGKEWTQTGSGVGVGCGQKQDRTGRHILSFVQCEVRGGFRAEW